MFTVVLLAALLGGGFVPQSQPSQADICGDVSDCRAQALEARSAHQYERFHDLAWRAVQKGKPNDPQLMYLLARAQSLSGRPDDALVMLGRLADHGVVADAATNPDFARVRELSTWPALEARLRAAGPPTITSSDDPGPEGAVGSRKEPATAPPASPVPVTAPAATAPPAAAASVSAPSVTARSTAPSKTAVPATASPERPPAAIPAPPSRAAPESTSIAPAPTALTPDFDASAIAPVGLAHDDVSRRFVLGDRNAARLVIIDDVSHHVVTLVSRDAGFYDHITGFTIDDRRGDLWVTSTTGDAVASRSRLHKLQLVSGRVLEQIEAPALAALVDVAVAPDGTVYGLDGAGSRLLKLRPGARSMDVVMPVPGGLPHAIASADEMLYVATTGGIVAVNPDTRSTSMLRSSQPLTGIQSLAWHHGALVAVQHRDAGSSLILLSLDRLGLRVAGFRVLGPAVDQSPVTIAGHTAYYVAAPGVIAHVDVK